MEESKDTVSLWSPPVSQLCVFHVLLQRGGPHWAQFIASYSSPTPTHTYSGLSLQLNLCLASLTSKHSSSSHQLKAFYRHIWVVYWGEKGWYRTESCGREGQYTVCLYIAHALRLKTTYVLLWSKNFKHSKTWKTVQKHLKAAQTLIFKSRWKKLLLENCYMFFHSLYTLFLPLSHLTSRWPS